jgi:hypothetical protein
MSQENVELARRVFASADPSAFYALFSADIEYDMRATPCPTSRSSFEAGKLSSSSSGDIVERGTGRASGLSFERRWYHVWTLRDGELMRWRGYFDREQALEAAGLSE